MAHRVSVVIPALNEATHIERCVRSVLAQEFAGGLEVLVVDGRSSDGTAELARRAGATIVDNPVGGIPAAMNRGLASASGSVLLRFDAHAEMPAGYVEACIRALEEESGAASVGGWRDARGDGPWGQALGAALASPLGRTCRLRSQDLVGLQTTRIAPRDRSSVLALRSLEGGRGPRRDALDPTASACSAGAAGGTRTRSVPESGGDARAGSPRGLRGDAGGRVR